MDLRNSLTKRDGSPFTDSGHHNKRGKLNNSMHKISETSPEITANDNNEQAFNKKTPDKIRKTKNAKNASIISKLEYMCQLRALNQAFALYIRNECEKMAGSLRDGSFAVQPNRFFVQEANQYLKHLERLKSMYLREECSLWTFGSGDCGQLGLNEERLEAPKPTSVKNFPSNVTVLSCGGLHNAVVSAEGEVYTWGCNDDGALGLIKDNKDNKTKDEVEKINTSFVPKEVVRLCQNLTDIHKPPPNEPIKWVATGDSHTLALSNTGKVFFFGAYKDKEGRSWRDMPPAGWPRSKNDQDEGIQAPKGQQEFPVLVSHLKDRNVEMVVCGCSFNAAILDDKSLVTWGIGECGELGRPSQPIRRPDGSYDLERIKKEYLTPSPVQWNGGGNYLVHSVACGGYHMLIITQGFRVATTGLNNYGQLGHGDEKNRDQLTFVEALDDSKVKAVDGGAHHSLCLGENGRMIAFGRADSGQLGITDSIPKAGTFENTPVEVLLPGDTTANNHQPLQPIHRVTQISCGSNHNLAITESGDLYTWGYGDMGALGHGEEKDEYRPRKLKMKGDRKVRQAVGGGQHSALLCSE